MLLLIITIGIREIRYGLINYRGYFKAVISIYYDTTKIQNQTTSMTRILNVLLSMKCVQSELKIIFINCTLIVTEKLFKNFILKY
jgi:hypothetical protein